MKKHNAVYRVLLSALVLAPIIMNGPQQALAGEKGEKESKMQKDEGRVQRVVEFENDRVRVVRYHFDPHAKVPMHDGPDLVAVWLTNARLKLTLPDGTSTTEIHKAGETEWAPAGRHAGENLTDTPLEFISVQLK